MIDKQALDEVFPNNPIKEVAFEIRFPHNLRVNRDICELQEILANDYTELLYGQETSPIETVFTYHLISKKLGCTIKVSENRFAIVSTKYTNFESFTKDTLNYTQEFCKIFHIKQITRVGLRYINNIFIPKIEGSFPIEKYVKPYINLDRVNSTDIKQFGVEILFPKNDCLFLSRSAFVIEPSKLNIGTYVLDLDAFFEEKSEYNQLSEILKKLHLEIQIEFLDHVTEDYKQKMRGIK
ncbi:MAG: TIGR04255 family protein [Blastocatellia bacterium]